MRILAALLAVIAVAAGGAALWWWEPWSTDDGSQEVAREDLSEEFRGSACRRVAGLAAVLAEREGSSLGFLRAFGKQVAGIRRPPRAYGDLARGGRNTIPGGGFQTRFDDGTAGQARHFAGVAVATSLGGGSPTRLISIFLRDDPADTPDGRLTDEAIRFATSVLTGELELDETPRWLLDNLCRSRPAPE